MNVRSPVTLPPKTTSESTGSSICTSAAPLGEEEVELLAQHADHVPGQGLAIRVRAIRDALHPHGAGEEVGAGEGDLDRQVRLRLRERQLVRGEGPATRERPEHGGMADLPGRDVEGAELPLELGSDRSRTRAGR